MSRPEIPSRLLALDEITRNQHYYIADDDACFHLWEYVRGGRVQEHPTNQLIQNLKIPPSARTSNVYRWRYKLPAIQYSATALSRVVPPDLLNNATWIPIPPSASRTSPEYDPRLLQVLTAVRPPIPDIRELVVQTVDHPAREKGIPPCDRAGDYAVDESLANPAPAHAILLDDVLTSGCHFKAMQMVLERRFPGIRTTGLFLARTISLPEPVIEIDLEELLRNSREGQP